MDLEAQALVQAERAGRVLRIDPEHRVVHARRAQSAQGLRGQRSSEATAPPRASHADALQPAALDAEVPVLLGPDPRLHDARDLVAVPRDRPQPGVELSPRVHRGEEVVALLAMAPVVLEGLGLGIEDRPVLVRGDRPQLEAVRERRIGDVIQVGDAHEEEVADGLEAGVRQDRSMADLRVLDEALDEDPIIDAFGDGPFGWLDAGSPRAGPARSRAAGTPAGRSRRPRTSGGRPA